MLQLDYTEDKVNQILQELHKYKNLIALYIEDHPIYTIPDIPLSVICLMIKSKHLCSNPNIPNHIKSALINDDIIIK